MSTELPDPLAAPQPELPATSEPSSEMPPPDQAELTQSPFRFGSANPIVAPEIGESQNLLFTDVVESIHPAKSAKLPADKAAEFNLRFWVTAVGLGFVLLVAISTWRSKDGPPIPLPSTSKIPQVR